MNGDEFSDSFPDAMPIETIFTLMTLEKSVKN